MKIGAYQFAVSGDITKNMKTINEAVKHATSQDVRLLVFPECALTGYPPIDIETPSDVDFDKLQLCYKQLQELSNHHDLYLVVGTILKNSDQYYNSALIFSPNKQREVYYKRALWGWDKENFSSEDSTGVLEIDGIKIGIRICFEVRFPEYFRELYRQKTDLNLILFYDVADYDNVERYHLIKAHIQTRAVENVCHTLSVDAIHPYQTAPTALFNRAGYMVEELNRNSEGLLVYDLKNEELDFGEQGRKQISDFLT